MKELIKLEFRKLTRQKSLYICLAIMLGLILMSAIIYKVLMVSNIDLGDFVTDINNVDGIFFTLTIISNADLFIILGIVIAITYCFDFDEQTIKNIFARGYSRKSLFFSKVLSIICATTFLFIACLLFSFVLGVIFFGIGEGSVLSMFGLLGLQFLITLAYAMFFTLICVMCKKMSTAIVMNIIAPLVITLVLTLVDSIVKSQSFKIANYWLDGMVTNLTNINATTTSIIIAIVGSIIYMGIFVICGMLLSKKTEV